jgi:hypothetical protein
MAAPIKTPEISKAAPVVEDEWHPARLIPTTGIGGQDEQEQRATSSLLAVIGAVPEFGRALLVYAGAPAGRIRTYTEVPLKDGEDKIWRPDGAIIVERGKTHWRCLVEVKTGAAPLKSEQISAYLDLARQYGFDCVLTISNQITGGPTESPLAVDGRRLRKVALRHLSWWQVMTEAILQKQYRGVSDPDQAWLLGELIAYLDDERSGAGGFDDMGDKWVAIRDAARQRTLRANDPGVRDVVERWQQFIQYVCLGLRQDLGREVVAMWPRKLDAAGRTEALTRSLVDKGQLAATIRVPDAAAPMVIEADLRARQVITSIELPAPKEGRPRTRVRWLLRQLPDAPDEVRVEVSFASWRDSTSELLRDARKQPERLLLKADPKREPRSFTTALSREMGSKRGKGPGSFVRATRQQALDFYRVVVQQLRPWTPSPPRLPEPTAEGAVSVTPSETAAVPRAASKAEP